MRHGMLMMVLLWATNGLFAQSVQVYQLRNGMQVAYVEDTTRRLTHIGLTLRGGASLNPLDKAGFAHYFEHHFFGGIDSAAGSPSGLLRQVGMISTAATYPEHQTFTISMPEERLVSGLAALTEALKTALDREPLQERILSDIATELQQQESSPFFYLLSGIQNRLWRQTEAAKDVLGRYSHIKTLNLEHLRRVLSPYLHPGNCLLSATGPGDADSFFHAADSLLGNWRPSSAGAGLPGIAVPPLKEPVYFVEENEFSGRPLMVLSWPVPGSRISADDVRLAAAFAEVSRMHGSAFHRELTQAGRADALWWEFEGGYNPGQLVLRIAPKPDSIASCLMAVQRALHNIRRESNAIGGKEVVAAAEKHAALEAAMGWDRSATRLDMLGRRWAAMEPSWANMKPFPMPSLDALQAFAVANLFERPHVAGLLVNPSQAMLAEASFRPQTYVEPVAVAVVNPLPKDTVAMVRPNIDTPVVAIVKPELSARERFRNEIRPVRILFVGMTTEPDAASWRQLETVAAHCKANPEQKLYLNGYSDGVGDGVANYHLSIQRAKSVQKILVEKYGLTENNLILNPFGEAFPEFPDDTPAHRHQNRRVTFEFAPADAQPRFFIF